MASTDQKPLFTLPINNPHPNGKQVGSIICTQSQSKVYLLTFSNPPDNRLITGFCKAFILALDILEHSGRYDRGVVISTSSVAKFYSNGMDIEHSQFTGGYMPGTLYALWRRLLTYSMPTIALINGHAFAGGLMVAMMHDYRIMNPSKGYLSLNELELGMPLRPPMTAIFRMKLPASVLRKMILEAHRYTASTALEAGIVDATGGLQEALKFVEERQLVKKSQPGGSGKSVYGELKREMWRETVDLLDGWAEEAVRAEKVRVKDLREKEGALGRVKDWKAKGKGAKL